VKCVEHMSGQMAHRFPRLGIGQQANAAPQNPQVSSILPRFNATCPFIEQKP